VISVLTTLSSMSWVTGKIFFSIDLDKMNITLDQMSVLNS
jgi:hypothetical protein